VEGVSFLEKVLKISTVKIEAPARGRRPGAKVPPSRKIRVHSLESSKKENWEEGSSWNSLDEMNERW